MSDYCPMRPADLGLKALDELALSIKPSIKSARPSRTGQEARPAAPEEGLNGHHDRIAVLGKKAVRRRQHRTSDAICPQPRATS